MRQIVIHTPDRRRKLRVCHINVLKHYIPREAAFAHPMGEEKCVAAVSVSTAVTIAACDPEEDCLIMQNVSMCARLQNSEILADFDLSGQAGQDIIDLICSYEMLFSDVPTQQLFYNMTLM